MRDVIKTFLAQPELTTAALSRTEAKLQIKSHTTADDDLIDGWILAAGAYFYGETGRLAIREQLQYFLDQPPVANKIQLPCPPLVSVDAVEYRNSDGEWVSFDNGDSPTTYPWEVQTSSGIYAPRGWLQLKDGYTWPTVLAVPNAFRITFTAGYADDESGVPELVKSILRQFVGDMDRYRTNSFVPTTGSGPVQVPLGIAALIRNLKYTALETDVPRSCL